MQLTTCLALCHGSAAPQNWTRERFEMVNSLLCWRIRLISQTRQICSTYHSYVRPVNGKTNYANIVELLQITHFLLQSAIGNRPTGCRQAIHCQCVAVTWWSGRLTSSCLFSVFFLSLRASTLLLRHPLFTFPSCTVLRSILTKFTVCWSQCLI